jgi:thymidylate synthase ThyX
MAYACRILADSISPAGIRLTTLEVTFPRIVLAEFNTHRMLSRNSASSRAIPVEKQIARVETDPFVPIYWGKNQRGMTADAELTAAEQERAVEVWLNARDAAVIRARALLSIGVHKQITNRLLEPFMWHTVIVTATEWENFFALRCHPAAQPEIRCIAEMMQAAMAESWPRGIGPGGEGHWHLPLIDWDDEVDASIRPADLPKVSAGRCARVSYLTHDGKRDPAADIELCERLMASGHMSPLEHVARPQVGPPIFEGNFRGWTSLRKTYPNEAVFRD